MKKRTEKQKHVITLLTVLLLLMAAGTVLLRPRLFPVWQDAELTVITGQAAESPYLDPDGMTQETISLSCYTFEQTALRRWNDGF